MNVGDVMLRVVDALEQSKIPYMLVGAFSSNAHGIPRSTEDVDLVIELDSPLTPEFAKFLGDDFKSEPQLSFETNTGTQRQEFYLPKTAFKVELFRLSNDAFDQMRFQRRKQYQTVGRRVWMATPEDVIVMKLRWARPKDIEDVKDVMHVQSGKLDWKYIEGWCIEHKSIALMQSLRQSIAEI